MYMLCNNSFVRHGLGEKQTSHGIRWLVQVISSSFELMKLSLDGALLSTLRSLLILVKKLLDAHLVERQIIIGENLLYRIINVIRVNTCLMTMRQ